MSPKVPDIVYVDQNNNLNPAFLSLENELTAAARINVSYVPSQVIGSCTSNGSYDGMIGDLERNVTDFTARYYSYETLLNTSCPSPVMFDTILTQQNNHIISSPLSNGTKSSGSVHEAFLVFDWDVSVLFIAVYLISLRLLSASKSINRSPKSHRWTLTRIWLKQDVSDDHLQVQSQKSVLNTSKLLVAYFVILIGALINTDLITYYPPKFIDSVSDAIESGIKVAFSKSGPYYFILKTAPEGSEANQLLKHALNQSRIDGKGIFINGGGQNAADIKKRVLVTIAEDWTFGISDRIECLSYDGTETLHKSRDVILTQHETIFFSHSCNPEVRYRLTRFHNLAREFGLLEKSRKDSAGAVFSIFFNGITVPESCLYQNKRSDSVLPHGHTILFREIRPFVIITGYLFASCLFVLAFEIIGSKMHSRYRKKEVLTRRRRKPRLLPATDSLLDHVR